jgi:hypothetical protein
MAIWDGSSLNTDALASAVNKWMELNFTPIVVKRNALLYAMMGLSGASGNVEVPNWNSVFKKDYQVQGNNLVVRLLGELETISTLADANQLDAPTWNNNPNALGAAVFAWTHYSHNEAVRDSEYELIVGNEARTNSYMEDVMQRLRLSWQDTIGTAINSTSDQARTTLGGWEYAIDSTGTYGTLTRAGDNPNWSGNETDVGGSGGLDNLDAMKLDILQDGGNPTVGLAPKVPFSKIKQELRGYTAAIPTSWQFYEGGGLLHYDGCTFAFEHRCTATVVGMFTPDTLRLYKKGEGAKIEDVMPKEIMRAVTKGASLGFTIREWLAFVSKHPGASGKLTNWTS